MRYYQPIGKYKDGKWTNFDMDYFVSFKRAKEYIIKKSKKMDDSCITYGLDVFNPAINNYIGMYWKLEDTGEFSRCYDKEIK